MNVKLALYFIKNPWIKTTWNRRRANIVTQNLLNSELSKQKTHFA